MYTYKAIYKNGGYSPQILEVNYAEPKDICESCVKLERKPFIWFIKEYIADFIYEEIEELKWKISQRKERKKK